MGAVDIGIGHDDDLVVAGLVEVELDAHARADGRDERGDGVGRERPVLLDAFDVENLSAKRQHGLDGAVAGHLGRTTCGIALDDEELGHLCVADGAVGELAGKRGALEKTLAACGLAGLLRGETTLGRLARLLDDLLRLVGVLLEVVAEPVGDDPVGEGAHVGAAELGLGLALELGVRQLDRDDRREALADVVAREVGVLLLENALLAGVVVDGLGEGGAEALEVHTALLGVDVVRERQRPLRVAGVPLHGDLDLTHLGRRSVGVGLALDVDRLGEAREDLLLVVEVLDEVDDAAGVAELVRPRGQLALVGERDLKVPVEESRLLETIVQGVVVVGRRLEDELVRPERDGGARRLGLADLLHLLGDLAARELHLVDRAIALDLHDELARERVDDGDTDSVETARHLVRLVVELTAGVQDGEHDLKRGDLLLGMEADGDAAAVVLDGNRVVGVHGDLDLRAEARHCLVDGVVHDLPHEVVQTGRGGGADVHARALAHRLEALEDLDLTLVVRVRLLLCCHCHPLSY